MLLYLFSKSVTHLNPHVGCTNETNLSLLTFIRRCFSTTIAVTRNNFSSALWYNYKYQSSNTCCYRHTPSYGCPFNIYITLVIYLSLTKK